MHVCVTSLKNTASLKVEWQQQLASGTRRELRIKGGEERERYFISIIGTQQEFNHTNENIETRGRFTMIQILKDCPGRLGWTFMRDSTVKLPKAITKNALFAGHPGVRTPFPSR